MPDKAQDRPEVACLHNSLGKGNTNTSRQEIQYLLDDHTCLNLAAREQFWSDVLNTLPNPAFIHDRKYRLLLVNRSYAEEAGMAAGDLIGRPYYEIFPQRDSPFPQCQEAVQHSELVPVTSTLSLDDGRTFSHSSFDVHGKGGEFLYGIHLLQDVTLPQQTHRELTKTNQLLERIFNNTHILTAYLDPQFNFLRVNSAYAKADGKVPVFFIGKNHFELYPNEENEAIFRQVVESREPYCTHQRPFVNPLHPERGTTWWDWSLFPIMDDSQELAGLLLILQDVTSQTRANQRLKRLNRIYAVISDCIHVILHNTDETELLQSFCDQLVESGGFSLAWVGYARNDAQHTIEPMASAGDDRGYIQQAHITWDKSERGRGPVGKAIRSGKNVIVHDTKHDPSFGPWYEAARERNYRSMLALPLRCNRKIIGTLNLYSAEVDAFDSDEVENLATLAEDLSYAIESLREKQKRVEADRLVELQLHTIENSRNGVMIAEPAGHSFKCIYVNPAFSAITGYAKKEVLGKNPAFLHRHDTTQSGLDVIKHTLQSGSSGSALLRNYRKDGSLFWNELHLSPVHDSKGAITHWVGILNDITEEKSYREQLEYQSNHDTLTGLPNTNLLQDRLAQAITYAERHQRVISVLWLDIDGLKLINDSLGHAAGDRLLQLIAQRLRQSARPGDTVSRVAGDEFAIVLADVRHADDIAPICQRLLTEVTQPLQIDNDWQKVSANIGISVYPDDASNSETLLRNANLALHRSKESGKNHFEYYQPQMNAEAMERLQLENQLRQALAKGEFTLHYQPQVDMQRRCITGFEALIRWQHPSRGMVPPATFIPLAEECGLIVPIGKWVLEEACRQLKSWQQAGLRDVTVAVNLSARQLEQADIVQQIAKALDAADIKPGSLALELTESAVMRNPAIMAQRLQQMRQLGLDLAMDDFGTGYSSLSNLHRLPFDKIKIDRSFINTLTHDPHIAAIVSAIIAMAHRLKLKTVAEGVEEEAQMRFLERLDCDEIQGYYFGRPLPASEAEAMLRQTGPLFTRRDDSPEKQPAILVVDDDKVVARTLEEELKSQDYRVITATCAADALDVLAREPIQVILSDYRMPGMTGIELLSCVSELYPHIRRMMLTGYGDLETITSAVNKGRVHHILYKPWDSGQLRESVKTAFRETAVMQQGG